MKLEWQRISKHFFLPEFDSFGGFPNHLQCSMSAPKGSFSFDSIFCTFAKNKLPLRYDPIENNENQQT